MANFIGLYSVRKWYTVTDITTKVELGVKIKPNLQHIKQS